MIGRRKRGKTLRTIRQRDRTVPCPIAKVPEEVLLHIFDLVRAGGPHDVASLTLVHPSFYRLARDVQHRYVTIDLASRHGAAAAKKLDLIAKENLLPSIRELRVLRSTRTPDLDCLGRLTSMVPNMTALRSLRWDYNSIPTAVLAALPSLPLPVQLHVIIRDKIGRDPEARQLLAALAGCAALVSLTLDAIYVTADACLQLSQPLKQLLLTCPNLAHLSLDMEIPREGSALFPTPTYHGIGFTNGERPLRPLESLLMNGYPWGDRDALSRFADQSEGYPGAGAEMDYWADVFDWSALRRLEATSADIQALFANKLAPRLTALREVRFTAGWDARDGSMGSFLARVPSSLEVVSLPSLGSEMGGVPALARHAPTLRKLTVHQPEPRSNLDTWAEHIPSAAVLEELLATCPHLEEVGTDLLRGGGDWPRRELEVLGRCPRLRALELWFCFGDWAALGPLQPMLTASAAAELFAGLRRACPTLRELRVHSGHTPPRPRNVLVEVWWSDYSWDNATSFTCRVPEHGEAGAVAAGVAVTSPWLSVRLNARMQRIMKGEEKKEEVHADLIALRVALDGPLPHEEWERWTRGAWGEGPTGKKKGVRWAGRLRGLIRVWRR